MAIKVIQKNESIIPFFGDRMTIIGGLDPLGNQNTSDVTFQMILPGLNNVTGRLRYYSYYCWLLDQYSERVGSTDPKEFKLFIRKAEYLTALAAQFNSEDTLSISGSNYSKGVLAGDNSVISLRDGIYKPDGDTEGTYWKFPLGIFGQYYLGSMRDIGLITNHAIENKIYIRTESESLEFVNGASLAKAFTQNISKEGLSLFFKSLDKGEVTRSELEELLGDFSLTSIPAGTEEERLLTRMLIQKDLPRSKESTSDFRRSTIKFLLNFLEQSGEDYSERVFIRHCYSSKGTFKSEKIPVLVGWYFYQFNEYWQYSCGAMLNGVLDYLRINYSPRAPQLSTFIEEVADAMIEKLVFKSSLTLEEILLDFESGSNSYASAIESSNSIEKATNGLSVILSLFKENKTEIDKLHKYGKQYGLLKSGAGVEYFEKEFLPKLNWQLGDFIADFLMRKIILRHQFVAFRKMGNGSQSTQKFIIEEHTIRYMDQLDESFTGPRIGNLVQFLIDVGHLTKDYTLTKSGERLRNRLWDGAD
ncbi:MAG: hypothetical protein JJ895_05010 [Balneolaceae bacterium]|nr:hypothetical protein [Balneolaceae bacterium]